MNAGQRKIFLILTVVAFGSIAFFYERSAPKSNVTGPIRRENPVMKPELQRRAQLEQPLSSGGKAEGKIFPFALTKDGLESSIRAHPMPEVWLTLPSYPPRRELFGDEQGDDTYKVQLPKKVMRELTLTWKAARYYYYLERFGPQDYESRVRRTTAFTTFLHNTSVGIETTAIKTPDGERPLSWDEAQSLVLLMRDFARELLLQADETVRPERPTI